jgi:hypothetical protein
MISSCPPGMICLDNQNMIIIFTLVFGIIIIITRDKNTNTNKEIDTNLKNQLKNIEEKQSELSQKIDIHDTKQNDKNLIVVNRDKELMENPLLPPHRRNYYIEGPTYVSKGVPINIETRGYAGDYQQIGMLYREEVSDQDRQIGNNNDTNILPLFGKPMYSNSSKWGYYTSSDKFNNVKIPITFKGRDCSDDYGCDEIYDQDIITIPAYNGNFKVKIYKFDKPRYIPYI